MTYLWWYGNVRISGEIPEPVRPTRFQSELDELKKQEPKMVMEVAEIMTANPESANVTESVREVMHKLIEVDVRHLPIVEQGELVGMISDRDLREYVVPMASELETVNTADTRFDRPISELMQGDVIQVHPETDVTEVIDLMIDHRIGAVPVIQPTTGTLVGIVSYIDIIREGREFFEDVIR